MDPVFERVGAADTTMLPEPTDTMVVLAGIPDPETICPEARPFVVGMFDIVFDPAIRSPENGIVVFPMISKEVKVKESAPVYERTLIGERFETM